MAIEREDASLRVLLRNPKMLSFGLREGAKFTRALVNGVCGNGAGEICGFGARARRKRKNVEIAER